jgi:DNA-binding NarL/FixJ family response regulator
VNVADGSNVYPSFELAAVSGLPTDRSIASFEATLGALMSRTNDARQDKAAVSVILANAGVALREAAKAAADAAARARALAEGLDLMLAELPGTEAAPVRPSKTVEISADESIALSRRERQVLALVTQGHTNKAIADALFVSPNTVKTHVTSLLHKFHAETRTQLAAMAVRQSPRLATNERGLL